MPAEASIGVMVPADEEQVPMLALALAFASGWMRAEAHAEAQAGAIKPRTKATAADRHSVLAVALAFVSDWMRAEAHAVALPDTGSAGPI